MKQDKFTNRYIIKIGSSIVVAVLNMVIQMLLPRALATTEEFGFFTFNMNTFTALVVLANLSASNAMVSKFSKRNEEIGILRFYLKFYGIIALILNVGIIALYPWKRVQEALGLQTLYTVILALDAYIINKLLSDVISMYDASAISRFPALMQIVIKIGMSALVVCGYVFAFLNLPVFYVFMIAVTGGVIVILLVALFRDNKERYPQQLDKGWKEYAKEYFEFCRPLVVATIIAQLVVILMNYTLLRFSGAKETAMFGAAWQLNALVGYVFVPYAELMKREYASVVTEAQKLKERFHQSLQLMGWLTSYFAIFIACFSKWMLPIVYGNKYANAILVTRIIMYYTVFQALGQVTGSFLIATERTRAQAVLTIVGQALTLGCMFLFQVPNFLWPKTLGANGIALNYLVVNVINVTIMIAYIAHCVGLSKVRENLMYCVPILFTSIYAIVLEKCMGWLIPGDGMLIWILRVFVGGILYTVLVGGTIYLRPDFVGVTREAIQQKMQALYKKFKGN